MRQTKLNDHDVKMRCVNRHCDMFKVELTFRDVESECPFCNQPSLKLKR